jgi:hypothetical protein
VRGYNNYDAAKSRNTFSDIWNSCQSGSILAPHPFVELDSAVIPFCNIPFRSHLINRRGPRKSNLRWLARACGERSRIHASDEHTLSRRRGIRSEQHRPDAAKWFCPTGGAAFCLWLRCSSVADRCGYASSSTPYPSQKSTATRPLPIYELASNQAAIGFLSLFRDSFHQELANALLRYPSATYSSLIITFGFALYVKGTK